MPRLQHKKSKNIITVTQKSADIIMGNPLTAIAYKVLPEAAVPDEVKELIAEKEASGTANPEQEAPEETETEPQTRPRRRKNAQN